MFGDPPRTSKDQSVPQSNVYTKSSRDEFPQPCEFQNWSLGPSPISSESAQFARTVTSIDDLFQRNNASVPNKDDSIDNKDSLFFHLTALTAVTGQ